MKWVDVDPGKAIGLIFWAGYDCWRGNLGGRDKRRASFWRVGGWFHTTIAYGSGGGLPYIPGKNPFFAKACRMAIVR